MPSVKPAPRPHTGWVPPSRRPLPLLSPHREQFEALLRYPLPALRAYAAKRGVRLPERTTRRAAAAALVYAAGVAQAEQVASTGQVPFDSRDDAYPPIVRALRERGARRVLDLGAGPGLFAEALRDGHPDLERYLGVELLRGAVEQARRRLEGDRRFAFQRGDVREKLPAPRWAPDAVVLSFVLSYLDTHSADRLLREVSRAWPGAALVVALTFTSCVEPRPGADSGDAASLARRALHGEADATAAWDTARLGAYLRALQDHWALEAEELLPGGARVLWVARPYAGRGKGSGRQRRRPVRISGKSTRTASASS